MCEMLLKETLFVVGLLWGIIMIGTIIDLFFPRWMALIAVVVIIAFVTVFLLETF